jgi:hypothetical protein
MLLSLPHDGLADEVSPSSFIGYIHCTHVLKASENVMTLLLRHFVIAGISPPEKGKSPRMAKQSPRMDDPTNIKQCAPILHPWALLCHPWAFTFFISK